MGGEERERERELIIPTSLRISDVLKASEDFYHTTQIFSLNFV